MSNSIVSTKSVWPNYAAQNVQTAAASDKTKTLGKNEFMKILITQLQNQDPMQPLQDRDFIAQMAQFSSVEQIMNMADEMKQMRQSLGWASSLIGKTVSWQDSANPDSASTTKSGIVSAILVKSGSQYAKVEGEDIPMDSITSVADSAGTP